MNYFFMIRSIIINLNITTVKVIIGEIITIIVIVIVIIYFNL